MKKTPAVLQEKDYKLGYKLVVTEEGELISPERPCCGNITARLERGLGTDKKEM